MQTPFPSATERKKAPSRRGFSLVELLMAVACGSIVLAAIVVTGTMMLRTMHSIGNYHDLDSDSRNTLDTMSRDLRNTATVTTLTANQVTLTNGVDTVSYKWDGTNNFTRIINGESKVMLTGCDYLKFEGFQRNPTNNLQFVPATTVKQTKLISVSWRCSRQVIGAKINTESVQTAQICIRN